MLTCSVVFMIKQLALVLLKVLHLWGFNRRKWNKLLYFELFKGFWK